MNLDFNGIRWIPVVFLALSFSIHAKEKNELRTLIDSAPASLNPRSSLDAVGQRLELLAFRGLTNLDSELDVQGDLSEKWRFEDHGKKIRFTLKSGVTDHLGRPIDPKHVLKCMENTFFKEPISPHRPSFPTLTKVSLEKNDLVFHLSAPDPYFPKNISTIRYFAFNTGNEDPCREPKAGEKLITNGIYEVNPYPERFDREMRFLSRTPGAPHLTIELVREETSRLLKMMNGEADFALNAFAQRKIDWLVADKKRGFHALERDGTSVSYLAFNLRDPILKNRLVRRAIAHAIDRDSISRYKLKNVAIASSFLAASLPEGMPNQPFAFDPKLSERLLDEAGFPRGKNGIRFRLKYKSTTNKEGMELAQIYREQFKAVGIDLELEAVEAAVFFASIRKGNFQIYMSRWIGLSDGSIYFRTLNSASKDNRVGYNDPEMNAWTEASLHELDFSKRREVLLKVQAKMLEDLPYFPLWHWTNALVFQDAIEPPPLSSLSRSGAYVPFSDLRFRKDLLPKK